ncbi:MAG: amidohydrolase family protein [Opitutaceae bacterium]|nr:amidohydrolase family protein [Opitutaceae bacterium]
MRVIDVHTHPVFRGLSLFGKPTSLNRVIAHGRRHNIVHMIVLGDVLLYGATPNAEQLRKINNDTIRVVKARPDYFTGFIYLNPLLGERANMAEAERCLAVPGFRGIKLEIANNSAHPAMRHVAKVARTFNLPVLQHSWSTTNIKDRQHQSDPADTALFARRNPDVKVIMAHLTGIGFRGVLEAKGLPNLYIDTSGGFPEEYLIEFAAEHIGADHVLYGSDLPIRENSCTIGRILDTKLSAADKQKMLFGNTARLLNLNLN